ncbi:hypothetical protein GCM10027066_22340 [Dyella jejuensis]
MAVVYAGFDPEIERPVAIKCLHREIAGDPVYRERFQVEARAAGQLVHPHIVTILDAGEMDDGRSYLAMERLSGETLAQRVANEGFPSVPVIIDLVSQLAAALDYAHAHGVVHHDIKPENIMLVDGWRYAKITDFGIAERGAGASLPAEPLAEIGGTPAYMPLERLLGGRSDARGDLFSLGVVLYWLVAGRLPWSQAPDLRRLVRQRRRLPQPPIKPRDPATPSILIDIIRTLMAPTADTRYQRGAEVVDDLRLARRSYERSHEDRPPPRARSIRVRWATLLGAVLSLVLILGMLAIHATQSIAVTGLALDFGSSLGRMIARDAAENIVIDDPAATRALVQDVARNQQIDYLAIADRHGRVIASTVPGEIDATLPAWTTQQALASAGDISRYRGQLPGHASRQRALLFDVPIHYQTKQVGDLRLGISDAPLRAAQVTALWVIAGVLLVTLVAVVGAAYWLFRRLQVVLDLLADAMLRVARGDYQHRIRLARRDELGRLFVAFNMMTEALSSDKPGRKEAPRAGAANVDVIQPTLIIATPIARDDPA